LGKKKEKVGAAAQKGGNRKPRKYAMSIRDGKIKRRSIYERNPTGIEAHKDAREKGEDAGKWKERGCHNAQGRMLASIPGLQSVKHRIQHQKYTRKTGGVTQRRKERGIKL